MRLYIGDTSNLNRRIRTNHCSGNIGGSALRRHAAIARGYAIINERRLTGTIRRRLDLPNPRLGESYITTYIRTGVWKYVVCQDADEAKDFQYFAIQQLQPVLNIDEGNWNQQNLIHYQQLLQTLLDCPELTFGNLNIVPTLSGVYLLNHHAIIEMIE
jgi:hypothetical protein